MKKILLMFLLFFIFPGNIIVQSIAIAGIFIVITQSIKKKAKNYLKQSNEQTKNIINENGNQNNENKKEISYLKELKESLTQIKLKEKPKTYKKSKV